MARRPAPLPAPSASAACGVSKTLPLIGGRPRARLRRLGRARARATGRRLRHTTKGFAAVRSNDRSTMAVPLRRRSCPASGKEGREQRAAHSTRRALTTHREQLCGHGTACDGDRIYRAFDDGHFDAMELLPAQGGECEMGLWRRV